MQVELLIENFFILYWYHLLLFAKRGRVGQK